MIQDVRRDGQVWTALQVILVFQFTKKQKQHKQINKQQQQKQQQQQTNKQTQIH